MTGLQRYDWLRTKLLDRWRNGALSVKAVSFALIGVVNTLVDYSIFLIARAGFNKSPAALSLFATIAASCHCGEATTVALIAANMVSWVVAVTGSYILNSSITFAANPDANCAGVRTWRSSLPASSVGSPIPPHWCLRRRSCCSRSGSPRRSRSWRALW